MTPGLLALFVMRRQFVYISGQGKESVNGGRIL